MEAKYIFIIVILVLILIIIGLVFFAAYTVVKKVRSVKRKVQSISQEFFGTSDLREGIRKVEREYAETPKSIAGATSICLPRITADFPHFNYEEMKGRAQNVLLSYLAGLSHRSVSYLKDANSELENSLANRIYAMEAASKQEYFDEPKIHRTEITGYNKSAGRCTITFQTSIQYLHYIMDMDGNLVSGSDKVIEQARYNIDMIYIQDRSIVENDLDNAEGLNCPNCCGPIKNMGAKYCIYCNTPIIEYNIKVWSFSAIKEV